MLSSHQNENLPVYRLLKKAWLHLTVLPLGNKLSTLFLVKRKTYKTHRRYMDPRAVSRQIQNGCWLNKKKRCVLFMSRQQFHKLTYPRLLWQAPLRKLTYARGPSDNGSCRNLEKNVYLFFKETRNIQESAQNSTFVLVYQLCLDTLAPCPARFTLANWVWRRRLRRRQRFCDIW